MRYLAGAAAALSAVLVLTPTTVAGMGGHRYDYVHPPNGRRGNTRPLGGEASVSLSQLRLSTVSTRDGQAAVTYVHGAFGFPAGQDAVEIRIRPLVHYRALHRRGLLFDGNVYGFTFRFIPSRGEPRTALKPIVLTLRAPQRPTAMLGRTRGFWRILCSGKRLIVHRLLAQCRTRILAPQLVLVRKRRRLRPAKPAHIPIPILIALAIVVLWAGIVVWVLAHRGEAGRTSVER